MPLDGSRVTREGDGEDLGWESRKRGQQHPWIQALELTLHSRPAAHARPLAGISPHMDLQTGSHQGWGGRPGGMCSESQQAHSHHCRRGVSPPIFLSPSIYLSLSRHNGASRPLLGPSSVLISLNCSRKKEGALL